MTESDISNKVRDGLRAAAREFTPHHTLEWERIESGTTARSIPDVRMRWAAFAPWIELKVAHGRGVRFQPGQTRWLMREWERHPGESWVLVGVPSHSRRKAALALYRGEQADVLAGVGIVACKPELYLESPILLPEWGDLLERLTWGGCECGCTEGPHGI